MESNTTADSTEKQLLELIAIEARHGTLTAEQMIMRFTLKRDGLVKSGLPVKDASIRSATLAFDTLVMKQERFGWSNTDTHGIVYYDQQRLLAQKPDLSIETAYAQALGREATRLHGKIEKTVASGQQPNATMESTRILLSNQSAMLLKQLETK